MVGAANNSAPASSGEGNVAIISPVVSLAKQILNHAGPWALTTFILLLFILYDKYTWNVTMLENQRQITISQAKVVDIQNQIIVSQVGVPAAVDRNRIMANQIALLVQQDARSEVTHRLIVELLTRIVERNQSRGVGVGP